MTEERLIITTNFKFRFRTFIRWLVLAIDLKKGLHKKNFLNETHIYFLGFSFTFNLAKPLMLKLFWTDVFDGLDFGIPVSFVKGHRFKSAFFRLMNI